MLASAKEITFVTGNRGKFSEAAKLIPGLRQADIGPPEIQADSVEEVARFSVVEAYKQLGKPSCFVEDAGLFVDALNGFPGVYSRYVLDTIGAEGLLKLMGGIENRKAHFEACIAYYDGKKIRVFSGRADGTIAHEGKGKSGFGFDPIFVPKGHARTFAEDYAYKQKVSHRTRALRKFLAFLGKPL